MLLLNIKLMIKRLDTIHIRVILLTGSEIGGIKYFCNLWINRYHEILLIFNLLVSLINLRSYPLIKSRTNNFVTNVNDPLLRYLMKLIWMRKVSG